MILLTNKEQILSGIIKRLEYGNVIVDLGKGGSSYQERRINT